jgi:hypothetical protein
VGVRVDYSLYISWFDQNKRPLGFGLCCFSLVMSLLNKLGYLVETLLFRHVQLPHEQNEQWYSGSIRPKYKYRDEKRLRINHIFLSVCWFTQPEIKLSCAIFQCCPRANQHVLKAIIISWLTYILTNWLKGLSVIANISVPDVLLANWTVTDGNKKNETSLAFTKSTGTLFPCANGLLHQDITME